MLKALRKCTIFCFTISGWIQNAKFKTCCCLCTVKAKNGNKNIKQRTLLRFITRFFYKLWFYLVVTFAAFLPTVFIICLFHKFAISVVNILRCRYSGLHYFWKRLVVFVIERYFNHSWNADLHATTNIYLILIHAPDFLLRNPWNFGTLGPHTKGMSRILVRDSIVFSKIVPKDGRLNFCNTRWFADRKGNTVNTCL